MPTGHYRFRRSLGNVGSLFRGARPDTYPRFTGLLDTYGGASAAYSLRAMSSDWLAGDVVEVRRSSDSTTDAFTASQITGGQMLDFVNGGTSEYYNSPYFNGSSDFILFEDYTDATNSIGNCTISCYFMSNDVSVTQMIFASGDTSLRTFIAGGNLRFGLSTVLSPLSSNTLYFMELDIDAVGNCIEARLNGNIVNTATNGSAPSFGDFSIGCRSDGVTQDLFFDGFISDFNIGDRAYVPLINGDYDIDNNSYTALIDSTTT